MSMTLAAARVNCGMKQKDAAKALGVSVELLQKWEKGLLKPKVDKIILMVALYNVPFEELNFYPPTQANCISNEV